MTRPMGVTVVAVVVWLAGTLEIIRGLVRLFTASNDTARADGDVATLTVWAIVTIIVGIAVVILGFGVFNASNPARLVVTVVLALLVADAILSAVYYPGELILAIIAGALAAIGAIVLYTPRATAYFTQVERH